MTSLCWTPKASRWRHGLTAESEKVELEEINGGGTWRKRAMNTVESDSDCSYSKLVPFYKSILSNLSKNNQTYVVNNGEEVDEDD